MIKFKTKKVKNRFAMLHPALLMIFIDLVIYVEKKYKIEILVTETVSTKKEDLTLNRVSDAHQKFIAIDFSTRNMTDEIMEDIKSYLETKKDYEKYKYLSYSGKKRLLLFHNSGHGHHGHLQIHSKYAIKKQHNFLEN